MAAIGNPNNQAVGGNSWYNSPSMQMALMQMAAQMLAADPKRKVTQNFGDALIGGIGTYANERDKSQANFQQQNQQQMENIMNKQKLGIAEDTAQSSIARDALQNKVAQQTLDQNAALFPSKQQETQANIEGEKARTGYTQAQTEDLKNRNPIAKSALDIYTAEVTALQKENANRATMGQPTIPIDRQEIMLRAQITAQQFQRSNAGPFKVGDKWYMYDKSGALMEVLPTGGALSPETSKAVLEAQDQEAVAPGTTATLPAKDLKQQDIDETFAAKDRVAAALKAKEVPAVEDLRRLADDARRKGMKAAAQRWDKLLREYYGE